MNADRKSMCKYMTSFDKESDIGNSQAAPTTPTPSANKMKCELKEMKSKATTFKQLRTLT